MTLEVRVVDETGKPLAGVVVTVRGGETTWTHQGTLLGELPIELANGIYDFSFTQPDHYELILKGIEIDLPDDPCIRGVLQHFRVMMQRRRGLEPEREGAGRRTVAPPPLAVSFLPGGILFEGRSARGTFRLTNQGDAALQVPLERASHWTPDALVMGLRIVIPGTGVALDEVFLCIPPDECRELPPGQSIEIPVRLRSEKSYSVGRSDGMGWVAPGVFEGSAQVYFIQPQGDSEVPTYTEPVESSFQVTIREDY